MHISKNSEWDPLASGEHPLVATDFWAPLCRSCNATESIIESVLYTEHDTKFARVKVDRIPATASKKCGTKWAPVVKFLYGSKEVGEVAGYAPKDNLSKDINKIMVRRASSCLANLPSAKPPGRNTFPCRMERKQNNGKRS